MDPSFQFWKRLGPEESNEIRGLVGEPGGTRTHDPLLKRTRGLPNQQLTPCTTERQQLLQVPTLEGVASVPM